MPNNIVPVDTWSDPLTTRADGDAVNAANILAHCNQGLANRSLRLMNILRGTQDVESPVARTIVLGPTLFTSVGWGEDEASLRTTRTLQLPATDGMIFANNNDGVLTQWGTRVAGGGFQHYAILEADSQIWQMSLADKIPHGAVITAITALVDPNVAEATVGDQMRMTVQQWTDNFAGPSLGSITEPVDVRVGNVSGLTANLTGTGLSIRNRRDHHLVIQIRASINAADAAGDNIYGIEVAFGAPGVANQNECGFFATANHGEYVNLRQDVDTANQNPLMAINLNRYVPNGSTINTIRVLMKPGAARGAFSRCATSLYKNTTKTFSTPNAGLPVIQGSVVEDDGTTNVQSLTLSPALVVDSDMLTLLLNGGEGDLIDDRFYGVEVSYDDPGPRNN